MMRILILILSLAVAGMAVADDTWQLAELDDGSYFAEGDAIQVYPAEAVLVEGVIRYDEPVKLDGKPAVVPITLEAKGVVVRLVPVATADLPEGYRFVVPVQYKARAADGKPEPVKAVREVQSKHDDPAVPEGSGKKKGRGPVTAIATGAAVTLAALGTGAVVLRGRKA